MWLVSVVLGSAEWIELKAFKSPCTVFRLRDSSGGWALKYVWWLPLMSLLIFIQFSLCVICRCEDLHRFRLRLRCLRLWSKRLRLLSQACCHDRRRVLSKALYVLRWAAKMHCAQNDAVERRRCDFLLYQSFYQVENLYNSPIL